KDGDSCNFDITTRDRMSSAPPGMRDAPSGRGRPPPARCTRYSIWRSRSGPDAPDAMSRTVVSKLRHDDPGLAGGVQGHSPRPGTARAGWLDTVLPSNASGD